MKKWMLILLAAAVAALGLWFLEVFPDPYHSGSNVNIYTWVYREIDELIHGEKG